MWGTEKSIAAASENWRDSFKFDDYRVPLIGLHCLMDCWKILLFARQLSAVRKAVIVPPQFVGKMDPESYKAKRKIALTRNIFVIFVLTFMFLIKTLKLALGYHAFVWELTAHYGDTLVNRASWYAAWNEVFDDLTLLPVSLSSYLLFQRKTMSCFAVFLGMAGHIFFAAISAAQTMMFLIWLTDSFGANALFYTPLALNVIGLVLLGVHIYNDVPNSLPKLVTLTTDVQLKKQLQTITNDVRYPIERIYVDNSISGANAYFMGIFGANMIAVSPELMSIMGGREVAACVGHELGHWFHHHNSVLLVFELASVLFTSAGWFYAFDNPVINQTFRFKEAPQAMIPVNLWIAYVSPLVLDLIAGVSSLVGCRCEYTADAFTVPRGLGQALVDSLITMVANARGFPFLDTWFSAWFSHHPTVLQRIKRLTKIRTD